MLAIHVAMGKPIVCGKNRVECVKNVFKLLGGDKITTRTKQWPWYETQPKYPKTLESRLEKYIIAYSRKEQVQWHLNDRDVGNLVKSLCNMVSLNVKERKTARQMMESLGLLKGKSITGKGQSQGSNNSNKAVSRVEKERNSADVRPSGPPPALPPPPISSAISSSRGSDDGRGIDNRPPPRNGPPHSAHRVRQGGDGRDSERGSGPPPSTQRSGGGGGGRRDSFESNHYSGSSYQRAPTYNNDGQLPSSERRRFRSRSPPSRQYRDHRDGPPPPLPHGSAYRR